MEKKKAYSYLDSLSSGYDAEGYDNEQEGKKHEETITEEKNWGNDKRNEIGKAAYIANKKKRLANKLKRISRELEALGKMEEQYKSDVEEMEEDPMAMEIGEGTEDKEDEINDDDDDASNEEWLDSDVDVTKEASHPIQHDPNKDDPAAFAPSDMGDSEWISIGPGKFDDKRDQVGKATK
jgi:hypothetical protein